MRRKTRTDRPTAERVVKDIRRMPRKHNSAEEKIRIVLEGLRGEESIAALCRREGIATSLYYAWSREFLEAGKKRLAGDTARQATSPEVKELRSEATALNEAVADLTLENRLLKKARSGMGAKWKEKAALVTGFALPRGHAIPEEATEMLPEKLSAFLCGTKMPI